MPRYRTLDGRLLRAGMVGLCVLLGGCGTTHGADTKAKNRAPLAPVSTSYSVLNRPGRNGISVIAPSQVPVARLTRSHPIWVTLPPSHRGAAVRPIIDSARELVHMGRLRVWLAHNAGGGLCMLDFNPGAAPDPEHDHSLLVFCGRENMQGRGELIVAPWTHRSYFAVGAVPDGVPAVVVTLANGERRNVSVAANSYHLVVPVGVTGVTFPGEA